MSTTVLVPLDGSTLAEHVLPHARALADLTGGRIVLVRAVLAQSHADADVAQARQGALHEAVEYLSLIADRLRTPSRAVATFANYGDAAEVIATAVRDSAADLIIMSTHGRSGLGRWLLGSVADRVHRQATIPVLLVPASGARPWASGTPRQILVALDGSNHAEAALRQAATLARRFDASILLLQVVLPPYEPPGYEATTPLTNDPEAAWALARDYLEERARPLRAAGLTVTTRVETGSPVTTIAAVADEQAVMLMILGGGTSDAMQRANAPVLLVRPATTASPATQTGVTLTLNFKDIALIERALRALLAGDGTEAEARLLLTRLEALSGEAPVPA